MEINITSFFESADFCEFSASQMERGVNAGPETWAAARVEAASAPLLTTEEELDALRDHMRGFGAWEDEEIDAWSADECNALLIQLVSGDAREAGLDCDPTDGDWSAYEADENASHNLFRGTDGKIYYELSM